jgi:hypothetical protein
MMNGLKSIACLLWLVSLGACTSNTALVDPCCYTGEYVKARFHDVYLKLGDGREVAFLEVFDGFEPDQSAFAPYFPMRDIRIGMVTFATLRAVLPEYDANDNGVIEEPELTVLYVRESARGFGYDVTYIGTNPRVDALVAARADVGGLLKYLERRTSAMNGHGQALFRDLRDLVYDARAPFVNGRDRKIIR